MSDNTLKIASVLAFERKLDPSDALFYSGSWENRDKNEHWQKISIREKSIRGTISNRLKAKDQDPSKVDASIENANLQTVDVAMLPADADTLKVSFTMRVLPGLGKPSACNSVEYQAKLESIVENYAKENSFAELAQRYAQNLANGRFLWRNRIGAEQVETRIAHIVDGKASETWKFDALKVPLKDFNVSDEEKNSLAQIASLINNGLAGKQHVLFNIVAYVRIGEGQEVFPSQELILDKGKSAKSRTLYSVNDIAGIHSQKLGNAIRTIDTWYENSEINGPIAIEPYGSVTTQGKAYRQPKGKLDFYNLFDNWIIKDKVPPTEQQHYVMAILIRGGVFGATDEKTKDKG